MFSVLNAIIRIEWNNKEQRRVQEAGWRNKSQLYALTLHFGSAIVLSISFSQPIARTEKYKTYRIIIVSFFFFEILGLSNPHYFKQNIVKSFGYSMILWNYDVDMLLLKFIAMCGYSGYCCVVINWRVQQP